MEWQAVGTIATSSNYILTPVVTGTLFKLKHITESFKGSSLKIAIRQAFEDNGILALFDYKLINCKVEQDILLFSLPRGLNNRKLAFKRVDNYLSEEWIIEIESLEIVEDGVNLPITISDVTDLQQRLNSIQDELFFKALDLDLDSHTANSSNPHNVTASQVGAELAGSAITAVTTHESTTNHSLATTSAKGMMAAVDKSKLDGIAPAATANQTNAFLLSRLNQTGTQPISTVEGLQTSLSLKALDLDLDNHTANSSNPHSVTASQVGADLAGSAISAVVTHESTTNHPLATTSIKGMMAAVDKSKLDGIAPAATANQTNAFLLSRLNHTGVQPIGTVEGLQTALSLKALDLDLDNHTANSSNPHSVTASQVGAELAGSAIIAVVTHESTTNHLLATTSAKGMMAAGDKSKLDSIAPGATANQTNAFLLSRLNQTGTQPISTVEGLQTSLSLKALDLDLDSHTANISNPHSVTASQVGADLAGSAVNAVILHETTVNHPLATSSSNGLLESADKTKLNGVASGATANSTDAQLRDRSTHTGFQLINNWIAPTFQNNWADYFTGQAIAAYRKLPDGTIELKGMVRKSTTPTTGEIIFTLPVGFRPLETRIFATISNSVLGRVDVQSNGNVVFSLGSNAWINLQPIKFVAEQ